jgi:protein SCO1/2
VNRTLLATLAVLLAGVLAFGHLTQGFSVLTAEAARRQAVARSPFRVPGLVGIDQRGARRSLVDPEDHRVAIVDFVYTRCTSICSVLGSSYQQLQAQVEKQHLAGRIHLVTVSFDPEHDTPAVIADYGERLRAHPAVWTILSPGDRDQLRLSLKAFGIVVTPAQNGQFVHNAAFHLVDQHGRLARIIDIDQPQQAVAAARQLDEDDTS